MSISKKRALIEEWMPVAELSEECNRERRSMTALPPTYYLHVWWARRPLVASRAAILGALLPEDVDREKFLHVLGIHGDPVAVKEKIEDAKKNKDKKTGKRKNLGTNPYGYERAFKYIPTQKELSAIDGEKKETKILDPTAGGGSIPFEAERLRYNVYANDLNPVSWIILKATAEFPIRFGNRLLKRFNELSTRFIALATPRFTGLFPEEPDNITIDGYLWARTITCPYCTGIVPLSPNWRLNNKGTGVRLIFETKDPENRHIRFEIVEKTKDQSEGTVKGGNARCPFPDCRRTIEGVEIKAQAQAGRMGEQLFAIAFNEDRIVGHTKAGKPKVKPIRGFRSPRLEDDVRDKVAKALDEKMPEWLARGIAPDEERYIGHADRSANYGIYRMQDMFFPRQLYGHCTSVEIFQELLEEYGGPYGLSDLDKAAFTYISFGLDKILNWNAVLSSWNVKAERLRSVFDRHDFAFKWSFAEMAPTITGLGYDWAFKQTGKALKELIELTGQKIIPEKKKGDDFVIKKVKGKAVTSKIEMFDDEKKHSDFPSIHISCQSGDYLPHIEDASINAVVMDPPYYDNVMYAELSDFFYVWLKRTAGLLYPEQFSTYLTDKDNEAVANPAKFKEIAKDRGVGVKSLAARDYRERMQAIFSESRRVLKPDGIMVLMFTHKASGAWDALAKGLVEAGFVITASWPINTEAEGSLHIKDKNAAKSTIFLVCRPRLKEEDGTVTYWENVEPKVRAVVGDRVKKFQESGIGGVDLYLSCFGPALEVFSSHWPIQRGRAVQKPEPAKGAQLKLLEDEDWDPYAVRPEDALMAARTAVKQWRLAQLSSVKRKVELDPVSEFFVLAWDAFRSPQFPADEALKLSRVVGVSFDRQLRNRILEVKSANVILWDSITRSKKGAMGSSAKASMLDALHSAARIGREQNTGAARDFLEKAGLLQEEALKLALQTLLNVLPPPKTGNGKGPLAGAAADCDALEKLRQLVFAVEIPAPRQLKFGKEF